MLVPDTIQGAIDFFANHKTTWDTNKVTLNITAAQITSLNSKVAAAQTKLAAAQAARLQSKAATVELEEALADLRTFGASLIKVIRATAQGSATPLAIYSAAEIPPPGPNAPLPPPDAPQLAIPTISNTGKVTLKWKSNLADREFYNVYRKLQSESAFRMLAAVASKQYVDEAVPQGTESACYYIIAQRSDKTSVDSNVVNVYFGAGAGTGQTVVLKAA